MEPTKRWYQSKAVIGGIVQIFVLLSLFLKLDLDTGQLTETVQAVAGAISSIMIIWGRISAKYKIQ